MNHVTARDEILQRIPKGCIPPARFHEFIRANPLGEVRWTDLRSYDLLPSAHETAVPFLHLPDGGLVVLWYQQACPAVVHIGGHGELRVVARDFDDFLRAVMARCTGLYDLDEPRTAISVAGVEGIPQTAGLAELQGNLQAWFNEHTALQAPLETPAAELLRQRVFNKVQAMIAQGLSTVYSPSSPYWSMQFQIERTGSSLEIAYLDYGKWHPLPEQHKLDEEAATLVKLAKHRDRRRYELSVSKSGIVSIDRERELVLIPPERKSKLLGRR
jgi:hypothetical protein